MGAGYLFKAMAIMGIIATTVSAQVIRITSMERRGEATINTTLAGNAGIVSPIFNGGAMDFAQVFEDLRVFVRANGTSGDWVVLNGNAESGFIWGENWGAWWPPEGYGGIWIYVDRNTNVRLQSSTNTSIAVEYTLNFTGGTRTGNELTIYGSNERRADNGGSLGISFNDLRIGGAAVRAQDRERFVYQIRIGENWVAMDNSASTFTWQNSGYNNMSPDNQWGFWWEHGGGIWFQPITQNYNFRIGFPENGQAGGTVGNNWATFSFVGNPSAPRPDPSRFGNIPIGDPKIPGNLTGWRLYWNDEFEGAEINRDNWRVDQGWHLGNPNQDGSDEGVNCGTRGWGNNELQHYRDHPNNVFVQDGYLHLVARANDPRHFTNCNETAYFSSGKVLSDRRFGGSRFSFKYGRIDFRIQLPGGVVGTWPAAWMMPEYDVYGGWASSGEIDVMEGMGRLPNQSVGAIHFGGAWPANTHIAGYNRPREGRPFDTRDFNVYSVVWQEDSIKWYVNGYMFFAAGHNQWHSVPAAGLEHLNNPYAPFDQYFHIIMNLAIGGWFDPDGTRNIDPAQFPATMRIDYVRVFKADPTATQIGEIEATQRRPAAVAGFAGIRNGQISLRLQEGAYTVELYSLQGRLISSRNINAVNGINSTGLRTDNLGAGVHILNVKRNGVSVLQQRITATR
ncbi:MAG: family 16 glycosylhydrolase [Chitinivibrionia bacterium]|nr:family 16 glycosylhydrolase [Chitinivibrionia bacterium]